MHLAASLKMMADIAFFPKFSGRCCHSTYVFGTVVILHC